MATAPNGEAARQYDEIIMLVKAYGQRLAAGGISYADMLKNIERLASLGHEARHLWGDR